MTWMKNYDKELLFKYCFFTILTTNISHADMEIKSPEGGRLIFSQEKKGGVMKNIHGVKLFFIVTTIRQISVAATDII
ncbi:hypothetical protein SMZ96_003809 [Cronobacter muytjensii]|nr:hypothetical protein [Cronobacter muytjensii]